jgi:hypothetical protein
LRDKAGQFGTRRDGARNPAIGPGNKKGGTNLPPLLNRIALASYELFAF